MLYSLSRNLHLHDFLPLPKIHNPHQYRGPCFSRQTLMDIPFPYHHLILYHPEPIIETSPRSIHDDSSLSRDDHARHHPGLSGHASSGMIYTYLLIYFLPLNIPISALFFLSQNSFSLIFIRRHFPFRIIIIEIWVLIGPVIE